MINERKTFSLCLNEGSEQSGGRLGSSVNDQHERKEKSPKSSETINLDFQTFIKTGTKDRSPRAKGFHSSSTPTLEAFTALLVLYSLVFVSVSVLLFVLVFVFVFVFIFVFVFVFFFYFFSFIFSIGLNRQHLRYRRYLLYFLC